MKLDFGGRSQSVPGAGWRAQRRAQRARSRARFRFSRCGEAGLQAGHAAPPSPGRGALFMSLKAGT